MSIHPALLHTIIRPNRTFQAEADKHVTRHFVSQVGYLWVIWTIVEIPEDIEEMEPFRKSYVQSSDGKSLLLWHTVRMTKDDVELWLMEEKHQWDQIHRFDPDSKFYAYNLYEM